MSRTVQSGIHRHCMWRTVGIKYSAGHVAEAALGGIWAALQDWCHTVSIGIAAQPVQLLAGTTSLPNNA